MKRIFVFLLAFMPIFIFVIAPHTFAASKTTTVKLSNGAVYSGEVKNGKPNGKGTMKYSPDKSYTGSWVNGKRSGYGVQIYNHTNKTAGNNTYIKYAGNWKEDKYDGTGLYLIKDTIIEAEKSEDNFTNTVQKGNFKNNTFTSGFSGVLSSWHESSLSYKDSKINIEVANEYGYQSNLSQLSNGEATKFGYLKRGSGGNSYILELNSKQDPNYETGYKVPIKDGYSDGATKLFDMNDIITGNVVICHNDEFCIRDEYVDDESSEMRNASGHAVVSNFNALWKKYVLKFETMIKPYKSGLVEIDSIIKPSKDQLRGRPY
ncbi:hypothetical protein H6F38_19950 [Paenibacillus sp. EKM208P]|nr:hypothetical protein H6F38_19950 [Paenibacillus sp. EKM208P]